MAMKTKSSPSIAGSFATARLWLTEFCRWFKTYTEKSGKHVNANCN